MPDTNRPSPCPVCTAAAAAPPIDPAVSRKIQDLLPEGARIVHQLYLDQREHELREAFIEIGRLKRELRGKGPHPQPRRRRDPKLHVIHHDVGIRCTSPHDGEGACIKCCCGEWVRPEAFEQHLEEGARPPNVRGAIDDALRGTGVTVGGTMTHAAGRIVRSGTLSDDESGAAA